MNNIARPIPTSVAALVVAVTFYACTSVAPASPAAPRSPGPKPAATQTSSPIPAPSVTAAASLVTPAPSVGPAPSGPALTKFFTSGIHGISVSYPASWSAQRASKLWTGGLFFFQDPVGDFLYDPSLTDHLFLALASQPLTSSSFDGWAADLLAMEGCASGEPLVVDGSQGLIGTDCNLALISADGRGYIIWLYVSRDDPLLSEVYGRAWFERVLTTVQLDALAALTTPAPGSTR